jgi:hypothetical protein
MVKGQRRKEEALEIGIGNLGLGIRLFPLSVVAYRVIGSQLAASVS